MKIEEMRRIHQAATEGQWKPCVSMVQGPQPLCLNDLPETVAHAFKGEADALAIVTYHNTYAKLLRVVEASKRLRECGMQFDDAHAKAEHDWMSALNAVEL